MRRCLILILLASLVLTSLLTSCAYNSLTISGVSVSDISQTSAVVTWQTSKPSDSQIEYWLTSILTKASSVELKPDQGECRFVIPDSSIVTNHTITLTGLESNTTYHFRVSSSYEGLTVTSANYIFTTLYVMSTTSPTGYIPRSFTWDYAGSEWTWDIQVPNTLYDYYREKPRPPTEDYSVYITHPLDDYFIADLVQRIEGTAWQNSFNEYETVSVAVSFVQSLPYAYDNVTTPYDEYPRYPIETLVDNGGDCEDTSILLAAILNAMDYDIVLLNPPKHVAVGILGGEGIHGVHYEHNGGKYFYIETTGEGWEIGEIPDEYKGESAYIYDIVPIPILAHNWTTTTRGCHVTLKVMVKNLGTARADDVYIFAGFDAGSEMVWNSEKSSLFDLEPGYSTTITLKLDAPVRKYTRLIVKIVDDDYAVDESYSDWFDT